MRQFVVIVALLLMLSAIDATAETRQLNFTGFDEVDVGGGMQVSIVQGATYRVEVTGSAADLDRLRTEHSGSRLTFSRQSGFWGSFQAGRISLNIILPALRTVKLSRGANATLAIPHGAAFAAALSGGSRLTGQLACGDTILSLSGGSRVELSGSGQNLLLKGSGGSRYDLKTFSVTHVASSLSGGSQATVTLDGGLSANLSGGSHITYFGNAALAAVRASGGSKVQKGL
jgi:hypothetical protein